jgi:hypothetical protein
LTSLESISSSLFNSVQEKASNAIMRLTDTIQNMISTDIPLVQIGITEAEQSTEIPVSFIQRKMMLIIIKI